MNAGRFALTLILLKRTRSGLDDYGQPNYVWKRSGFCAARQWQLTNDDRSDRPIESQSNSVRLLCRSVALEINQRIKWRNKQWRITAVEEREGTSRDFDSLITVEPVA
jgi:hypothetical protein